MLSEPETSQGTVTGEHEYIASIDETAKVPPVLVGKLSMMFLAILAESPAIKSITPNPLIMPPHWVNTKC